MYLLFIITIISSGIFYDQKHFLSFITLMNISCNLNKEISHFSDRFLEMKNNDSYSANYLTANYSISKGDAYTASHILKKI